MKEIINQPDYKVTEESVKGIIIIYTSLTCVCMKSLEVDVTSNLCLAIFGGRCLSF